MKNKKSKAGRKRIKDKKKVRFIYVRDSIVKKFGNEEKMKQEIYTFLETK